MQVTIAQTRKRRKRKNRTEVLLGKARVESPAIRGAVAEYVSRTVEELGGYSSLAAGHKAMLLAQKTALTIILAVEEELVASGRLASDDGKPLPLLKTLQDYLAVFRQGQVALGLARPRLNHTVGTTLEEVIREYSCKT